MASAYFSKYVILKLDCVLWDTGQWTLDSGQCHLSVVNCD